MLLSWEASPVAGMLGEVKSSSMKRYSRPKVLDEEAVVTDSMKQDGGCKPDGSCTVEQGQCHESEFLNSSRIGLLIPSIFMSKIVQRDGHEMT